MGGVDLADQWISHYTPDLRYRGNCFPMIVQYLKVLSNKKFHLQKQDEDAQIEGRSEAY